MACSLFSLFSLLRLTVAIMSIDVLSSPDGQPNCGLTATDKMVPMKPFVQRPAGR